jgi:hypothetical protein
MKIGKILLGALAVLLVGGGAYLLIVDVPVVQTDVSQEIPHEKFSQ